MTPYELGIMLHYYARAEDHRDITRDPPVWRPTIQQFLADDLLAYVSEGERDRTHPMCYRLTLRGKAFVEALQQVPLPTWRVDWHELAGTERS